MNNPDFLLPSGETIAEGERRLREIESSGEKEVTSQKSSVGNPRSAAMATRPGVMFVADTNNVVRRGKQILSREGGAAGVEDGQDFVGNPRSAVMATRPGVMYVADGNNVVESSDDA
eukprot:CAMPEP_0116044128 /NCGR_PEP_ID=MMETSP0321-20121206/26825_1 /TAXON_ID=163516 /ORGANISM="Leptocylindrus danicus var. danicus, Strain B650" /LENGTH=116 /DNA_ID=CAMNT_0003525185 /DNA_START=185 /DNA_END=532 /DNA_ORIENTATION=+